MSVDKFGRYSASSHKQYNLKKNIKKIIGVQLDAERNLDLNGKRILNVGAPVERSDAVTKSTVSNQLQQLQQDILLEITKNKQDNIKYIQDECEKLKTFIIDIESNLKSYIQKALTKHIQYVDKLKAIFNHITTKKEKRETSV